MSDKGGFGNGNIKGVSGFPIVPSLKFYANLCAGDIHLARQVIDSI